MYTKITGSVVMFATTMACAAPPATQPTRLDRPPSAIGQLRGDPNEPGKKRVIISSEERERVGLAPHKWKGIVDPQAYAGLEQLKKTVTDLMARQEKGKDQQAYMALASLGFKDKVYVEVQVKSKEDCRPVLASLTAPEFHVRQVFKDSAGFVGYASKDALNKLAKDPKVTGVCLDDKNMPEPEHFYARNVPAGDAINEPGVSEGKVDPRVYLAFALTDRVPVFGQLRPEPTMTDWKSWKAGAPAQRDRVLATLTADDFSLRSDFGTLSGYVTKEGVRKLAKNPDLMSLTVNFTHDYGDDMRVGREQN